jgi:periplasmic protein TonB
MGRAPGLEVVLYPQISEAPATKGVKGSKKSTRVLLPIQIEEKSSVSIVEKGGVTVDGTELSQQGAGSATIAQMVGWGNTPPVYPDTALQKGWEGTVWLKLELNTEGLVERTNVAQSSGFSSLDRAALEAAERWRIPPQLAKEQSLWKVPVVFRLER